MYRFSLTIILILFCLLSQAQNSGQRILLKDGTEVQGELLSMDNNGQVTIKTEHLETLKLKFEAIAKIENTLERPLGTDKYFSFETALLANNSNRGSSVRLSYHQFVANHFSFGMGAGIDVFDFRNNEMFAPLFLNATIISKNRKIKPYLSLDVGYGFSFHNKENDSILESTGGFLANPRIGVKIFSDDFGFSVFSGIKFQKASYIYDAWNGQIEEDIEYRRLEFGLGFHF